ncbi:amino-acid permease inda1 [Colletotrichum costaricense]|uniref:Amino-acid permease inda1 n=1 Tax=Colletotrichum costaricense TaxID=1209916 RepID=A0AAI9YLC0_9PEZI|nr:amino-acid permease inda1 [Colletotrichum costaricense]KAK1515101.1 amino-acid permease inda1 [Colletotrichum costaricense]
MTVEEKKLDASEAAVQPTSSNGEGESEPQHRQLSRALKGRHMQMIAIGMSLTTEAIQSLIRSASCRRFYRCRSLRRDRRSIENGRAGCSCKHRENNIVNRLEEKLSSLQLIGFIIIGCMMMCTVQALGELAIIYPVNGAFYEYAVRFIDPAWGFAMGWEYSIGWMVTLPFEITAAGITIEFWKSREEVNPGVWCAVFMSLLIIIQVFGIIACIGFIILGIIINAGGVPTDPRGYIGAQYWHNPGAFRNGFQGFCSVFVTAAFSFGGTEMVGLAAAEAKNPRKTLPKATRQVFWRIALFYILNIFIMGLIVPSDSDVLLGASGANTKASPFVLAVQLAGIQILPHIINGVITCAVISVANSCTYGSTRVLQALAQSGRAPSIFAKIDKSGRPIYCVALQVAFGFISFITVAADSKTVFNWLLAVTGLSGQFAYASIMIAHIRFRKAWRVQGRSTEDIPWRSALGVVGSYVGVFLVCCSLAATFYSSLFPVGGKPSAESFFQGYLAAPITISLFLFWKVYTKDWGFGVDLYSVDLDMGRRPEEELDDVYEGAEKKKSVWKRGLSVIF